MRSNFPIGVARLAAVLSSPLRSLPTQCALCRNWSRARLCEACMARFAQPRPRCERCAIAVPPGVAVCGACLREPPPFARAVAAVDYAPPWDELVRRFKFDAALDLADALADRIAGAVRATDARAPDWLLPVPLADERLRERGYNQAWELARRVARALPCASDPHLLLRTRQTPHQLSLPPAQRAANVRGAFAVEPRRRQALRDRDVALLDDVMTTGATLSEAARSVLQAGAASVQVWVLARTPRPDAA
ncbi:MAG: ComF family protein [Burkholderiaceae bacterium]|nr:ComF family protein [Burkholderiaceae bacterium]